MFDLFPFVRLNSALGYIFGLLLLRGVVALIPILNTWSTQKQQTNHELPLPNSPRTTLKPVRLPH